MNAKKAKGLRRVAKEFMKQMRVDPKTINTENRKFKTVYKLQKGQL